MLTLARWGRGIALARRKGRRKEEGLFAAGTCHYAYHLYKLPRGSYTFLVQLPHKCTAPCADVHPIRIQCYQASRGLHPQLCRAGIASTFQQSTVGSLASSVLPGRTCRKNGASTCAGLTASTLVETVRGIPSKNVHPTGCLDGSSRAKTTNYQLGQ